MSSNIYIRWKSYRGGHRKYQSKLYNSFKKHGYKNHKFEVIHYCSPCELNDIEKYYIELFQSCGKNGLNVRSGRNGKMADESIAKGVATKKINIDKTEVKSNRFIIYYL